jgi:hypothetical protein
MAALELVFVALAGVTMASLAKALSHKYIKRVPYVAKDGKRRYRYWYRLPGSGKLVGRDDLVVGAAFQAEGGHYHVTMAEDGKVTVRHDETKKEATLSHDALAALLHEEHKGKIAERGERLRRTLAEAEKVGNPKLVAARKKDLDAHQDAYEPRPKEAPKPKAPPIENGVVRLSSQSRNTYAKGAVFLGKDGHAYEVTQAQSTYIREDGLSMGLGDDTGWIHTLHVRPAGADKAKELLERQARHKEKRDVKEALDGAMKRLFKDAPWGDFRADADASHHSLPDLPGRRRDMLAFGDKTITRIVPTYAGDDFRTPTRQQVPISAAGASEVLGLLKRHEELERALANVPEPEPPRVVAPAPPPAPPSATPRAVAAPKPPAVKAPAPPPKAPGPPQPPASAVARFRRAVTTNPNIRRGFSYSYSSVDHPKEDTNVITHVIPGQPRLVVKIGDGHISYYLGDGVVSNSESLSSPKGKAALDAFNEAKEAFDRSVMLAQTPTAEIPPPPVPTSKGGPVVLGGVTATKAGRSILLTGATYHIKEDLKGMGAKYSPDARGWKMSEEKYIANGQRLVKLADYAGNMADAENSGGATGAGYRRSIESGDLRTGAALLREFAQRLGGGHDPS